MDIYSRKSLSRRISDILIARFYVIATTETVRLYEPPGIVKAAWWWQLPQGAFVTAVTASAARLIMDGKGAWPDTSFIERFWCSLKVEQVTLRAYETLADAKRSIRTDTVDGVNASTMSAHGIHRRPGKPLIFQQNLSHKQEPAYKTYTDATTARGSIHHPIAEKL